MKIFTDQLGNQITVSFPPQRIISLVPSQTELLADLGLENRVVGITKFCAHPHSWQKSKVIIGGTKNFRRNVIQSLQPDLIIGNKEENYQEGIAQLQQSYPVWMSDIVTFDHALGMMKEVGELTNTSSRATEIISQITRVFSAIERLSPLRTLYLIWNNPCMGAAAGTFIHELLSIAGLQNCLQSESRYPNLTDEDIKRLDPELILLSTEPYPFQQKHVEEFQVKFPKAKVVLVDGEMFSWYGSRLMKFPTYIKSLKPMLH